MQGNQNKKKEKKEVEDDEIIRAIQKEKDKAIQVSLVYLDKINSEMNYSEDNKYHRDYVQIRNQYEEKCFELYREMSNLIKGTQLPQLTESEYELYNIDESACSNEELSKPIEAFWLDVLDKSDFFKLTDKERNILKFLNDIQLNVDKDNKIDITISFYFNKNEYFTNEVLTKAYIYNESNEKLYKSIPTPIEWIVKTKPSNKDLNFFFIFDESQQISLTNEENEAYFFKNDLMQNLLIYYLDIDDSIDALNDVKHLQANLNCK